MKFTKEQLKHIEKILNPNTFLPDDEKDLQLDVSFHKVDEVEMAKIHIASKEEVEYSKWEDFLSTVENKIKEKEKKHYFILNLGNILTVLFFVPLYITIFILFKDNLQQIEKTVFYIFFAVLPLIWYLVSNKFQRHLNNKLYKNINEELLHTITNRTKL